MKTKQTPKITVVIRKRPLNKKELSKNESDIVKIQNRQSVIVSEYKQKVDLTKYIEETTFNFDHAYDEESTNESIYEDAIRPLIDSAFEGAKISCFAYGQTGSGKTFTMKGDMAKGVPGLYYLAAKQIFNYLQHPQFQRLNVFVSFYQIYCGKLFDLLTNRTQLKIREDKHANINIIGLEEKPIYGANEFLDIIEEGSALRITSQNATNADSSRSHAIMQIHIKDGKKTFSKVSFIDLAGNQRGADHMDQNKQTKIDGAQINKSLLALKQCIRALDQGKGHTPFRGSKLTMVLKDSFVGFCKTVMIGNVSPNVSSSQNTMNTLRYADRVKQLKRPSQNLTKQQLQAKQLMLPRAANKNTIKVTIDRQDDADDIRTKLEMAKKKTIIENEKMEIEGPMQKEPVVLEKRSVIIKETVMGKRGESTNNFRVQEKKTTITANNLKQQHQDVGMGHQKIDIRNNNQNMSLESVGAGSKKSLLMMNGALYQKNNNINSSNQDQKPLKPFSAKHTNPHPLTNLPLQQLNRQHFDAMNNLHSQFSKFKDNHSKIVKQETIIIRDEMMKLGEMSEVDEWSNDTGDYLDLVDRSIDQKIKLMQSLQKQVQNLKRRRNQADQLSRVLQQRRFQQQKYKAPGMQIEFPKGIQVTSSNNSMKYIYHSSSSANNQQNYHQYSPQQQQYEHNNNTSGLSYRYNNNQQQQQYQYSNVYGNGGGMGGGSNPFQQQQHSPYMGPNTSSPNSYQFSQYHQHPIDHNNYSPHYLHSDQQLLQDLPGDENMQRLF